MTAFEFDQRFSFLSNMLSIACPFTLMYEVQKTSMYTGTYSLIWRMLIVKRRACFVRRSGFRWGDHNPAADFVLSISVVAWMVVLEVMMASLWMVIRISVLQSLPELAVHKIVEEELLLYFFVWTKVSRLWLTFAKAQQSYTVGGAETKLSCDVI